MNYTYNVILGILGEILFQHKYMLPASFDGDELLKEAVNQSVFPLIYSYIKQVGKVNISDKWEKVFLQNVGNNVRVLYEHSELLDIMGMIPFTTIKGARSAFYYPNPVMRSMGDVDFFVEKDKLDNIRKILENKGFQWDHDKEHGAHMAFHRMPKSTWEMHWNIQGIPKGETGEETRKKIEDIIETSQVIEVSGKLCRVPDEFHHCLVMLIHTANHMIRTGVGLRHICDWAVFVNKVDVSLWKKELQVCGLWKFAQVLTQVSVRYLHLPWKEWAMDGMDETILKAFIMDVFEAGNFGRKDSGRINQAKLITDKEIGGVDNTLMIVRLFREVNCKAKIAAPSCEKNVLLRPFAWGYILVRHIMRICKGQRPKIELKSMVQGAEKRRVLYRTFRLYEGEMKRGN